MTYPTWICDRCGRKHGRFYINGRYVGPATLRATYHEGTCDVCGFKGAVTEPRDYGHLVPGWDR